MISSQLIRVCVCLATTRVFQLTGEFIKEYSDEADRVRTVKTKREQINLSKKLA